jgi:3-phosphoshikimate 1-carboxyvinyltransferase
VEQLTISHQSRDVRGEIFLSGSKSISNRALLIRALAKSHFAIHNLSNSDDTVTMEKLIRDAETGDIFDAHHAGTTFRFLTAYFALNTSKDITLTGSERMQERPIGALVDALNSLGANITYLRNEGYPPLKIGRSEEIWLSEIVLPADISSQYISAILMIAPYLPNGLKIRLEGDIVSKPYIDMTINMMSYFGVNVEWINEDIIAIPKGTYVVRDFYVEGDWSSASYFYSMIALANDGQIKINGLRKESMQGDSAVKDIYSKLGVDTQFDNNAVILTKRKNDNVHFAEVDFIKCPDLAQTVFVTVAGLGYMGLYTGLQTLYIKETDRVNASRAELEKFGVFLSKLPSKFSKDVSKIFYSQEGKATSMDLNAVIATYNDHRMAMAFAPLALIFPISIANPNVVSKSFPMFWAETKKLGFNIL